MCVPESQVPVCPPACAGQSASAQHPPLATQMPAAAHFFMLAPQVKSQLVPSQVAVAPVGGLQASHCWPQVLTDWLSTQVPAHRCCVVPHP